MEPGLDASPTRMPKKLICQRTKGTAIAAPCQEKLENRDRKETLEAGEAQQRPETIRRPETHEGKHRQRAPQKQILGNGAATMCGK